MNKSRLLGAVCAGVLAIVTTSSYAALIDRGGGLIYDDVLNVTWLQNANLPGLSKEVGGTLWDWNEATTWANGLNYDDTVRGVIWSDWRLPSMDINADGNVVDCSSVSELACRDNEFGYLYFQNGITPNTPGDFIGLPVSAYWSGTTTASDPVLKWSFGFSSGQNVITPEFGNIFAWAVRDGDVGSAVVPIPPAPLEGRLPLTPGGTDYQAYYDPNLDVTWLADMDLAYSEKFGVPGITANMGGFAAQEYIIAMNNYDGGIGWLGVNNWRLPTTLYPDTSCTDLDGTPNGGATATGYNCIGGELGHLYYEELGGTAGGGLPGLGGVAPDISLFTKNSAVAAAYWTSPEIQGGDNPVAVIFSFNRGYQSGCHYDCGAIVWPVADGDVIAPSDSDDDGLLDSVEDSNGNGVVDAGETDPLNPDTDGDGALDGQEDINANGIVDAGEADPLNPDSDGDGLTDGYEINVGGTDPNSQTTVYTKPGDMNGDGEVNVGDLLLLQREILGL